jgi:hypothetical protein
VLPAAAFQTVFVENASGAWQTFTISATLVLPVM